MLETLDPGAVKASFDALRSVLDTYKSLRDNFTRQPELHERLNKEIEQAEREMQFAEAQLALALGHKLCRAHFPPVPMLLDRVHPDSVEDIFKCPRCAVEDPSPEYFARKTRNAEAVRRHNERARANSRFSR